jgi:hypothetical protein
MHLSRIAICALALWGSPLAACIGGPVQNLDVEFDCSDVCNRHRSCFDSDFDTAACEVRCHERAGLDPGAADRCDACMEDRTCADLSACSGECYALI